MNSTSDSGPQRHGGLQDSPGPTNAPKASDPVLSAHATAWKTVPRFAKDWSLEDVQDTVHDVVLRVMESASAIRDLRSFTFGVARVQVLSERSRQTNRTRLLARYSADLEPTSDSGARVPVQVRLRLSEFLSRLREEDQMVIRLYYERGLPDARIADLGISRKLTSSSGVRQRRKRIERRIRRYLESRGVTYP